MNFMSSHHFSSPGGLQPYMTAILPSSLRPANAFPINLIIMASPCTRNFSLSMASGLVTLMTNFVDSRRSGETMERPWGIGASVGAALATNE